MIDHINVPVSNLSRAVQFYTGALEPLGYRILMTTDEACGIGPEGDQKWIGTLWIGQEKDFSKAHVAFRTKSRDVVDRFYKAALQVGGKANGAPGIRAHYHEHYYAAFVLDPDGHNIEVVCHEKV